jgi:DUF4097 and DUF4098 domain-containing protein YvlB
MKATTVLLAVAASALAAGALDAQSLDTTVAVRSGARLEVGNFAGTVRIRPWGRAQIRVQADYDRARIDVDATPTGVSVRARPRRGEGDVDFTISVPVGTPLEVHGVSADVDVRGVNGEAQLESISGGVTLEGGSGEVTVQSVSGDVSATGVRGRLEIASTSGDVIVRQLRGNLNARSVSGDVSLDGVDGTDVGAGTVSGDIEFGGPIRESGRYRFESHSGDVTVRPEGDLNATVSVSTFSGDLESDWPITLAGGRMRPREWEGTVGTGGARVSLESFSGTIYLRRGSAPRRED